MQIRINDHNEENTVQRGEGMFGVKNLPTRQPGKRSPEARAEGGGDGKRQSRRCRPGPRPLWSGTDDAAPGEGGRQPGWKGRARNTNTDPRRALGQSGKKDYDSCRSKTRFKRLQKIQRVHILGLRGGGQLEKGSEKRSMGTRDSTPQKGQIFPSGALC